MYLTGAIFYYRFERSAEGQEADPANSQAASWHRRGCDPVLRLWRLVRPTLQPCTPVQASRCSSDLDQMLQRFAPRSPSALAEPSSTGPVRRSGQQAQGVPQGVSCQHSRADSAQERIGAEGVGPRRPSRRSARQDPSPTSHRKAATAAQLVREPFLKPASLGLRRDDRNMLIGAGPQAPEVEVADLVAVVLNGLAQLWTGHTPAGILCQIAPGVAHQAVAQLAIYASTELSGGPGPSTASQMRARAAAQRSPGPTRPRRRDTDHRRAHVVVARGPPSACRSAKTIA